MRVEYDLERVAALLPRDELRYRESTMWRYAELLPVADPRHILSLGEGWTPLVRLYGAERMMKLRKLWVKREEQNPTGSFKARGFSCALTIAREAGIRKVAVNSNGNAGSALAAYAAHAGMEAYVFLPQDCPGLIVRECLDYGAHTCLIDGLIHNAGQLIAEGKEEQGWHHVGTLREHGRAEGKKTMGLELAEQLGWRLPDVIIYPTGGGSGIIGMWNAFTQLRELGWIEGELPRFVCVQEEGCDPLVRSLASGGQFRPLQEEAGSSPTGLRVPHPPDGEALLAIIRETSGTAVAVSREEIREGQRALGRQGISSSPEGAATWAAMTRLMDEGWIGRQDEVVLFNTSHAMKYVEHPAPRVPVVKDYADWRRLMRK
jgi:threonine synthase